MRNSMTKAAVMLLLLPGCFGGSAATEGAGEGPIGKAKQGANGAGCIPDAAMGDYAVCVCKDFDKVGNLELRASADGHAASIGVNGRSHVVSAAKVEGSWVSYNGIDAVASMTVRDDQSTSKDYHWTGNTSVGHDLSVGGTLSGVGNLSVGGDLRVNGEVHVVGNKRITNKGAYQAPAAPPCACDGQHFFDVSKAVADAKAANDNAAVGLSPQGVAQVGNLEIKLPSGRYYVQSLASVGNLRFDIEGDVAIFVGSSIRAVGNEQFHIGPAASLDLYVDGSVQTVGNVDFGSRNAGGAFRLLVGGSDPVMLNVGNQVFYGHIYAPTAEIGYVGNTIVHGALFAGHLAGVGNLIVDYSGPVHTPPDTCNPPGGGSGGGGQGGAPGGGQGGAPGGGSGSGEGGGLPSDPNVPR